MKTITNKLDFILKCFVQCTFKCYNKLNFDVRKILRAKGGILLHLMHSITIHYNKTHL